MSPSGAVWHKPSVAYARHIGVEKRIHYEASPWLHIESGCGSVHYAVGIESQSLTFLCGEFHTFGEHLVGEVTAVGELAGENADYARHRQNSWEAALYEAAFITGLERNSDVVCQAAYAPLFAHVDGWQ